MTVAAVRDRLYDIMREYAEVNEVDHGKKMTVERYLPRQINAADCPTLLILPGEAPHSKLASDVAQASRVYRLRLYVAPTTQGITNEVEKRVEWFIDDLATYLDKKPRLEFNDSGLDGVYGSSVESDGGITEAQYPIGGEKPVYYLMVEWRLRVITRKRI